ncbi:hypothetical protein TPL01_01170 [Sulfuriferula plumbiphila]|uniref:Cytochrome b6 n=1 Tax=Sulfuriferula plumbiphila TaxID=171865 RepID=A0A512L3D4_9PROT|nr:DUF2189 domain-containing protein [Sulfuriferula plumbiphila]BBP02685.1 hypothetical protein SFPGR_01070 [Sulfuriferula plumbiphila]GEP28979.1 hypothetical protein TPL01_01170 [Sulfuriferula plumbiphila]
MDKIAIKPNLHAIDLPAIDRIAGYTRPLLWLRQGWSDMRRTPLLSLGFGALFAALGYALVHLAWNGVQAGMTLTSGFLLIAPFLAVVFYDLSRQAEHHHAPRLAHILKPLRANGASIGFYALLLAFIFSVWERLSAILVGVYVSGDQVGFAGFPHALLAGSGQFGLLLPYAVVGGLLAILVFALSVVSLPMMLHRKADLATALMTSLWVVRTNPLLMLEWALIIVALSVLGFVTSFIAMAVVFPLIGHATWHVYRDLVER